MNSEMNNTIGVSVTSLLLKTLENATKEYARECIIRCAQSYGFDSEEALRGLNLENLTIQVREMKKRSAVKKTEKTEKKMEKKSEKKTEKKMEKKMEKKVSIPLPFVASMVNEDGCGGLAYNCGLFTQCQKIRMSQSEYCKGCQSEADMSASGTPSTGTVKGRLAVGMMEFRDGKGRAPVAYTKIMEKQKLDRATVELEAGKLNIEIDELHFAVVEEKKAEKAGRPKQAKKVKTVTAETVEDLFAQLIDEEDDDSLAATVLMSDSEGDEEELSAEEKEKRSANEKAERGMMKEADAEMKKIMQAEAKKLAKEQKMAADLLAKEQAKEAKIAADLAAKAEKEQRLADEKAAKEAKIVADKLAKEQKIIDDKLAKEAKIAADLLAKEQAKEKKIADELAAKAAKEQKLIDDKLAKEKKIADEKAAKEAKVAAELQAKEAKKAQQTKAEPKVAATKPVEEPVAAAAPKKVTVKRITIGGKQYLKTLDNLLYDPETKEEMGIYDPVTNTIKELPEEDDDEIEEDGYDSDN